MKSKAFLTILLVVLFIIVFLSILSVHNSLAATYVPQPSEAPTTPIWDRTQVSCDKEKPYTWGSPGTYLYTSSDGGSKYSVAVRESPAEDAGEDQAHNTPWPWSYVETLPEPQGSLIAVGQAPLPGGHVLLTVEEVEEKTASWGTVEALKVTITEQWDALTGRLDVTEGSKTQTTWYICGYGMVRSTSSERGTQNGRALESRYKVILLSFTPLTTNESHVRYILADIQLNRLAYYRYRANITDEETAEALRRWDAGIRVLNPKEFERKKINEQWQIVYAGTENPIAGMDVILNSYPQQ